MSRVNEPPKKEFTKIAWVEDLPEHWDVLPFLAVCRENKRPNVGLKETNLLSLSYGSIVRRDINSNDGLLPASFETYQVVEPNDIVFRLTDLQNDKKSLRTALVSERGILTSAYLTVRLTNVDPRFFAYLMRDVDSRKVLYSMGGGLRQSMKFDDIKRLPVQVPPHAEQLAIADFLDRETGEIDAFIRDQDELIGLLQERRAAMINHAVTKGLNPEAEMRSSGTDLIGDVPATWDIRRLGTVIRQKKHLVGTRWDSHLLLSLTLRGVVPRDMENIVGKLPSDFTTYQSVERGDLVLCLFDVQETPRTVGLALEAGMVTGAYTVVTVTSPDVLPEYLALAYLAYDQYKLLRPFYAGLRNTIRSQDLKMIPVPVPPEAEQREIVDYLAAATAELDAAITDARYSVELSRQRRSALISAAVTGKIDVRERVGV